MCLWKSGLLKKSSNISCEGISPITYTVFDELTFLYALAVIPAAARMLSWASKPSLKVSQSLISCETIAVTVTITRLYLITQTMQVGPPETS